MLCINPNAIDLLHPMKTKYIGKVYLKSKCNKIIKKK